MLRRGGCARDKARPRCRGASLLRDSEFLGGGRADSLEELLRLPPWPIIVRRHRRKSRPVHGRRHRRRRFGPKAPRRTAPAFANAGARRGCRVISQPALPAREPKLICVALRLRPRRLGPPRRLFRPVPCPNGFTPLFSRCDPPLAAAASARDCPRCVSSVCAGGGAGPSSIGGDTSAAARSRPARRCQLHLRRRLGAPCRRQDKDSVGFLDRQHCPAATAFLCPFSAAAF